MKTTQDKIDRVFHLLESKGVECSFYPWGIRALDTKTLKVYEIQESPINAAKQLAIIYGVHFNAN